MLLLFAGRWLATWLADGWWADRFAPGARSFVSSVHILRLLIDASAVVIAAGWFIGHLVMVTRAVGSVQIPRHVANIEFREAIRPDALFTAAVGVGTVLGLFVGLDTSAHWTTVVLAWQGLQTGLVEPLLGNDTGVYLAQLPLWRLLHEYAFLLVTIGLAVVTMLYGVIGAIRFQRRRPAINDHARAHLGWLLASVALVLAWGYLLEPFELVAGLDGVVTSEAFGRATFAAPALTGTALMVAALSALWTLRPQHALVAAGWAVLMVASVSGHHLVPLLTGGEREPVAPDSVLREYEDHAFRLGAVRGARTPSLVPAPLFGEEPARRIFQAPGGVITIQAGTIVSGGDRRPAWLALTGESETTSQIVAVAADRVGSGGTPLFYRPGDSLAYPNPYPSAVLGATSVRPGAPRYVVGQAAGEAPVGGVAVSSLLRRMALAWALQAGELLGPIPEGTRIDWALSPAQRLATLAPFAEWSGIRARIVDGSVFWVVDGFLSARANPLVEPAEWRGGPAGLVRAAYLGIVEAATGEARIYLREDADPLARAWAGISEGVVEPPGAIPRALADVVGYPAEFLALQAGVLARRSDGPGTLPIPRPGERPVQAAWDSTGGEILVVPFLSPDGSSVTALLTAGSDQQLRLATVAPGLPAPRSLERRWTRFPTLAPVQDSVAAAGASIEVSEVRYWTSPLGVSAFQVHTAARDGARPVIVWVTVAAGDRLGAGRSLAEAWENLHGTTVPSAPGSIPGAIPEARHWMRIADEALKRSDWAAFGRAFDALRRVLQVDAE